ncbi:FimV/HubP family polar landmark protein [Polaromonas eurypsychrophila]|uniref:FimV/HubP family polar landmark protein n=1 Tax=Polaromonas eurypsychrophila TaxID=1614635 RepID=UPI00166DDDCE|nr:FimV/HubP family polar landmark protein [Polaromonas eurypsychrophila]
MNHPRRWRIGAVAAAVALSGSFASLPVLALGLGRVTVQSALGEPLRAEIDIAEINAEEAASLRTSVASADAFKAAGLEYSAAVTNVQITLQRRPDGRSYLRLSSDRPVSEPFVDLILEARWASGRIVRDYTMLFDPPNLRSTARPMPAPIPPVVSRPPAPVATLPPAPTPAAVPFSPPSPPAVRPAVPPTPAPAVTSRAPSPGGQTFTVKTGDTAGKIAAQTKPASISLDQMLVALLRSNPDAFIGGNVNRLKAGAVLEVPSADQAEALSASEASRTIVAQSRDFNSFRRKLAESAPATQTAGADRQAAGQVQAKVEDKAPAAATPDKLTLSKGAVQGKAAAEEKIAQDRQSKEAAARVAELSKNIADLNKLGAPSTPAAAAAPVAPAPASPAPGVAITSPAALAGTSPTATAPATPMAPASSTAAVLTPTPAATVALPAASAAVTAAPAASAAAPATVPAKKPVVAPPPPPPEPSLVDELLENPLLLAGAAILLLLLLALGVYRARQRKNSVAVDSSFLESRLQPDSFFGASGGQRIDTNEANVTGSSMVYSPSQLDAAGDVDPVAEADVYLAYGRDLQAEEILKEAIRVSPTRIAIHAKLMEIYAKRRDTAAFASVATDAFNQTKGHGVEWAHMAEMGRDLDPGNPMYQPDGQPPSAAAIAAVGIASASFATQSSPQAPQIAPEPEASAVDFDLDLDFSMGDDTPAPAPVARTEQTLAMPVITAAAPLDNGMDFSSATLAMPTAAPAPAIAEPLPSMDAGLSFTTDEPAVTTAATPLDTSGGMLEFDMGALSLDLDGPTTESQDITPAPASAFAPLPSMDLEDPLETKFALAEEFRAIGDADGARSLAEEVLAQSSGSLKAKAQAFLNALA